MNNTYETMSKVMGSKDRLPKFFAWLISKNFADRKKNPLFVQDEDIYGVPPPSNAGKGTVIPVHMPVRARYSLEGHDLTNIW